MIEMPVYNIFYCYSVKSNQVLCTFDRFSFKLHRYCSILSNECILYCNILYR